MYKHKLQLLLYTCTFTIFLTYKPQFQQLRIGLTNNLQLLIIKINACMYCLIPTTHLHAIIKLAADDML